MLVVAMVNQQTRHGTALVKVSCLALIKSSFCRPVSNPVKMATKTGLFDKLF